MAQKKGFPKKENPSVFFSCFFLNYTMPCAIIALATLRKPATFAPFT